MKSEDVLTIVLGLPAEERAKLAQELLCSLDQPAENGASEAWLEEIERRARELDDGSVEAIDWDVARQRIADRLRQRRADRATS